MCRFVLWWALVLPVMVQAQTEEPEAPESEASEDPELEDGEYRTPLAGKPFKTNVLGYEVDIPERDRGEVFALTLGSTYFTPRIGDQTFVPFLALYYKKLLPDRHARAVVSFLVNEIDYGEKMGGLDTLVHVENTTIPFATQQVVDGTSLEFTALEWGYPAVWLGMGWSTPLWPGNIDNQLRVQAYYQARYYYFRRADDTGPGEVVPSDTYAHGVRIRLRMDMLQRNIMEMPHYGFAFGGDVEWVRRDRWEDTGPIDPTNGRRQFLKRDTRDYTRVAGYFVFAAGIPFLSERHRLTGQIHAGWAPHKDLDRFSAFRLGGGPQPTEADDLIRSPYPGALFDQFIVIKGVVGTLSYRYELAFFVYLHLRATLAYGTTQTYDKTPGPPGPTRFERTRGETYSAAITTGLPFDSVLHLEYSFDTGALRAGDEGHTILFTLSKSF